MTIETRGDKIESKELNAEEKKQLGELWSEVILGSGSPPENITDMSDDEIKDWLSSSLMSEIRILSDEWGMVPDQKLIAETKEDIDVEEKAKRQMAYIEECLENINNFIDQDRAEKQKRSTRWDSWPKTMRENNDFNCVGATMLGSDLLDRAEIENYYGNPTGHVMNVVILSNENLVYVDFRNNVIIKIEPEEVKITGLRTFKIDNELVDYQLIPLLDKNGLAEAALGNLSSLIKEAGDSDVSNLNLGEKEARKIVGENSDIFERSNVHDIYHTIFSDRMSFHNSTEMQAEEKRIKLIFDFEDNIKELIKRLADNLGREEVMNLMTDNADKIEVYFSGTGELSDLPVNIRDAIEKIKFFLDELAKDDEKLSVRMKDKTLSRIRKRKQSNKGD